MRAYLVNFCDYVRASEAKKVIIALKVLGVFEEALASEIALGQLVALDHRAHRAVQDVDPLFPFAGEELENLVPGDRLAELQPETL